MSNTSDDTAIGTFRVDIAQADVDDLLSRLARTRWANELPAAELAGLPSGGPVQPGWQYGVPGGYLRELVERWRSEFDWRGVEAKLNELAQFTTVIDGQTIHFVHIQSPEPDATPLILTHGWPNTFVEYVDLIGPLTDPRSHGGDPTNAFHVVIPDIPGFGFSGPTNETGWDATRVAKAWAELMRRLGYQRYGTHGNDAGAIISPIVGQVDPDHVIGVHVSQIFSFPSGDPTEFDGLTDADFGLLQFAQAFMEQAVHDFAQKAQPQTLAHALADSPAGQLAWIVQLLAGQDPDVILTNASIYWFTNTAASAGRFYYENHRAERATEPTTTPIGLASFAWDMKPVRKFAERDHTNLVHWNDYDRGSHWAAHDAPDLLLADIRQFFGSLR
jgi:pimeloyl-ACP methyl ester carboxylesterase